MVQNIKTNPPNLSVNGNACSLFMEETCIVYESYVILVVMKWLYMTGAQSLCDASQLPKFTCFSGCELGNNLCFVLVFSNVSLLIEMFTLFV